MMDARVARFCERFGLRLPILLAPMAGVSAPALSIAVGKAGGMGALGALLMQPSEIVQWAATVRQSCESPFQLNLWIPDPAPVRDRGSEEAVRDFLASWGPQVPDDAGDAVPPCFEDQCNALLDIRPRIVSSVMGLFPPPFVSEAHRKGIAWFATVSTVREARAAEVAGADAIIAQGAEAGGHRAAFDATTAERDLVGLMSLVPAVADAVRVPVIATGGIADARTIAAALALGASAVQIGTGFLRCPEAELHPAWANAIAQTDPEDTQVSSVFSGRPGRSIATPYVRAATERAAPAPAPYPVQRGLTARMRAHAVQSGDIRGMQAWAGQSARLASSEPAEPLTARLWAEALALLNQ